MKRKIVLPGLAPVSINSAYYAEKKYGYKQEVKQWLQQVAHLLSHGENLKAVNDLKAHFTEGQHCFQIYFIFHNPQMFTKDGRLSSRGFDCSNIEKIILDALFLPAHANNLSLDDKHVTRMISEKRFADQYCIEAVIKIKNILK